MHLTEKCSFKKNGKRIVEKQENINKYILQYSYESNYLHIICSFLIIIQHLCP